MFEKQGTAGNWQICFCCTAQEKRPAAFPIKVPTCAFAEKNIYCIYSKYYLQRLFVKNFLYLNRKEHFTMKKMYAAVIF